jgi:hypothetical protein
LDWVTSEAKTLGSARLFRMTLAEITANGRMRRVLSELVDEVRRLNFLLPNTAAAIRVVTCRGTPHPVH